MITGSIRARPCSTSRGLACPPPSSSWPTRCRLPFADASFDRVFTAHFYGHLEEPEPRASSPRHAESRPSSSSSTPRSGRTASRVGTAGADPQRRHALGGLQALLRAGRARRRSSAAARRSSPAAGSSPSARDGPEGLVPFDRLAAARQRTLPRLRRGRLPARVAGRCERRTTASARTSSARRRGSSRARSGCRGGVAPASRLRRWLALDGDELYETFYCASVTRCYPGRPPTGRGDRTPTPREQDLCEFWRDWELELLRPDLIVTVGGLALRRLLGVSSLTESDRQELHARRRDRDPAAAPLRGERLAERPREPGAPREGADACEARARQDGRRLVHSVT